MNGRRVFVLAALLAVAANGLYADLISQALDSFPARTGYVEYENLASLRKLKDFAHLEQRYAGNHFQELKLTLGRLGIREDQVNELIAGSDPSGFYGIIAGSFREESAEREAVQKNAAWLKLNRRALCPGETCILFFKMNAHSGHQTPGALQSSVAAFGTLSELQEMIRARDGSTTRLSSNGIAVSLLSSTAKQAPVRGLICGDQLQSSLSDMLREWTGWKRDWSEISATLRGVGYSVEFDSSAHLTATLECRSATSATLLVQALRLLENVQAISANGGNGQGDMQLRNLKATSAGSTVIFKADTSY